MGPAEAGVRGVHRLEPRARQIRVDEDCGARVTALEERRVQASPGQPGIVEVAVMELPAGKVESSQIGSAQTAAHQR